MRWDVGYVVSDLEERLAAECRVSFICGGCESGEISGSVQLSVVKNFQKLVNEQCHDLSQNYQIFRTSFATAQHGGIFKQLCNDSYEKSVRQV